MLGNRHVVIYRRGHEPLGFLSHRDAPVVLRGASRRSSARKAKPAVEHALDLIAGGTELIKMNTEKRDRRTIEEIEEVRRIMAALLDALLADSAHGVSSAVLCCAVLCCAVLCCAVLCCAVLCCAVLCRAGQEDQDQDQEIAAARSHMAWYDMACADGC
jgi:hypothetical protein